MISVQYYYERGGDGVIVSQDKEETEVKGEQY